MSHPVHRRLAAMAAALLLGTGLSTLAAGPAQARQATAAARPAPVRNVVANLWE